MGESDNRGLQGIPGPVGPTGPAGPAGVQGLQGVNGINEWQSWSRYIISELKRLGSCAESTEKVLGEIKIEIATLKVKSGVWGAMAGLITTLGIIAIAMLLKLVE